MVLDILIAWLRALRARLPMLLAAWLALQFPGLCTAAAKPDKAVIGIYVNQIYGVSLKDNRFSADFYVWFRYDNDDLKPLESMEVVNGKIESKTGIVHKKINGKNYAVCRVVATINKFWDVSRYPIDRHVIRIEIEDAESDTDALVYAADADNTGVSPDAQVRGWKIAGIDNGVVSRDYVTNFGDTSLPTNNKSIYSRYALSIHIDRVGYGQFFKLFGLMFLSTFVSFLAFLVSPSSGPRFGLGTGALFAAAANSFVVGASLPESIGITLADQLQLTTIVLIFTSLLISTISLRLVNAGHEKQSTMLDKAAIRILPLFYFSFVIWLILRPTPQ